MRPWLFAPHGWDWRWLAWEEAAARVKAAAIELAPGARTRAAELGRPPRWAFRSAARPETVLLDLAIQAAGGVPVPIAEGAPEDVDGWAKVPAALDLEQRPPRGPDEAAWPEVAAPFIGVPTGAGGLQEIPSADLIETAGELANRIGSTAARKPRDIWVSSRSLEDPLERLLMTWALVTGAAVVLEPRARSLVPTAAWARPTVFAGDASEIAALVAASGSYRSPFPLRWWRRLRRSSVPVLPFDRLRTVVLCGDRELSGDVSEFLHERGVRILRLSFDLHRTPKTTPDASTWRGSYNIEALGGDT